MKRIVIRWKTDDPADLIFVARAVSVLGDRQFTALEYGDPARKRVEIHKTKAGYAITVESIGPVVTP